MKKLIFISIIVFIVLLSSLVSGISKYYSPIVTGQDLTGERVDPAGAGVIENLLLGTTAGTSHRTTFNTCVFAGSGDSDYRYVNVDEDGLIYLTDDDFINIFDDECILVATHTINGTLMSQPFIFDSEGDGFQNIYYISTVGFFSQINEIELANGILFNYAQFPVLAQPSGNYHCIGLYCDRIEGLGTCATFCNDDSSVGHYTIIEVNPTLISVINVSLDGTYSDFGFGEPIYDETNDFIRENDGVNYFDYFDRTFPAIYGMDIDSDDNIEVVTIHACSGNDICFNQVDLISQSMDSEGILLSNAFTPDADVFSSAGFGQVANVGQFYPVMSNGEMFVSFVVGTGTPPTRMMASVFNSVGSLLREIVSDTFTTYTTSKISNFAVSDIDGDLRNDYCIAFNNTQRNNETVIECYSGLTNLIMTNCTFSGWESNNPIHISLLDWDTISLRAELITTFGIFDLSTDDGTECNNLRSNGFTGLTSASEGVMLPVAVGGDTNKGTKDTGVDLLYYGADGARLFKTETITGEGSQSGELCGASHIMFCDDFNYQFSLFQRSWQVLERDGEINTSITPKNNKLNATDIKFQSFVHDSDSVDVNYTISTVGEERRIIFSFIHPVVSHAFKLNIINNNGLIEFRIDDRDLQPSVQLRFRGKNLSYVNSSEMETLICIDCITPNMTQSVKVTQFFGNDNAKEQSEPYPFNISVDKGYYRVFINNEEWGDNVTIPFANNASYDFSTWLFTKNKDIITGFIMDDIFSYRGTSQAFDNSDNFFTPIVEDVIFECQTEGLYCAYTIECCDDLTCVNNACTGVEDILVDDISDNALRNALTPIAEASNISLGTWWVIIMIAIGVVVFVGTGIITTKAGGESLLFAFIAFLIIEFLLLIVGTRLGLLPIGIIISITVVALVIIAIVVFKWVTGVSSAG